jgi:hypothetical protein
VAFADVAVAGLNLKVVLVAKSYESSDAKWKATEA